MSSSLDVTFTRDVNGKAIRVDYSLIGFPVRTWFGIYLNGVLTDRFRTNTSGESVGYLEGIPSVYDIALTCVGDFHAYWGDNNPIPTSGIIFGTEFEVFVELADSDGENQDRVGVWTIDVRYD